MKLCYLANASSVHTAKWVNYFYRKGHHVEVITFEPGTDVDPGVVLHVLGRPLPLKMQYFLHGRSVRRLLAQAKPDIVHAHYASGYGTLGRAAGFHPYVLSVWGSDVFEFTRQSPIHRELFKRNIASADRVCSTSQFMAQETRRFSSQPVVVTPFGVDCEQFRSSKSQCVRAEEFVVGTVRSLEAKYGIEYLIRSFAVVARSYKGKKKLRLVIAGDGSLRKALPDLARKMGIDGQTEFLGKVSHEKVPDLLSTFSVFAALSIADSETFGVGVVEASACEIPVVVTSVGGLPEVVSHRVTGLIVPPRDIDAAARALEELVENPSLCLSLGKAGRQFVLENYEWSENASRMERIYESLLTVG
jgi:L-malate glycosyltransferase